MDIRQFYIVSILHNNVWANGWGDLGRQQNVCDCDSAQGQNVNNMRINMI